LVCCRPGVEVNELSEHPASVKDQIKLVYLGKIFVVEEGFDFAGAECFSGFCNQVGVAALLKPLTLKAMREGKFKSLADILGWTEESSPWVPSASKCWISMDYLL
jgi:hypothetical protein